MTRLTLTLLLVVGATPGIGEDAPELQGMALYRQYCAQCHGDQGDGQGLVAPLLQPKPRDFTTASYKIRTTPTGELPTDTDLERAIRRGLPYTSMPGFDWLTDRQMRSLIEVIKSFSGDFADPALSPQLLDLPRAPRFSETRAEEGREVYERTGCAACHGDLGRGDGRSAPTLVDEKGDFIRAADLTMPWTFRGGGTREDIFRTMTAGFNGTPMPGFEEALSEEERWAITDYMYSLAVSDPEAPYAPYVTAVGVEAEIDLDDVEMLFAEAEPALFPLVGQVMQPGRQFQPSTLAIQVQAIYNPRDIAVRLTWHNMTANTSGRSGPDLPAPEPKRPGAPMSVAPPVDVAGLFADAVAVQLPRSIPEGVRWPYFLFGDEQSPVELWFANLAGPEARVYVARGSGRIEQADATELEMRAGYEDGAWTVTFKRPLLPLEGLAFEEGRFVPAAFTVWDGQFGERGNKRALTRWYSIYLEPLDRPATIGPVIRASLGVLGFQLLLVAAVRRYRRRRDSQPETGD